MKLSSLNDIFEIMIYISLALLIIYIISFFIKRREGADTKSFDFSQSEFDKKIIDTPVKALSKPLTVKYFTVFTFIGFILAFGLMGKLSVSDNIPILPSMIISFFVGLTGLIIFSLIQYAIDLMIKHDVIYSANTIGMYAFVSKDIPAKRGGEGKVIIKVNDKISQFTAVTNDEVTLTKGTKVKVSNSMSDKCIVVEPFN